MKNIIICNEEYAEIFWNGKEQGSNIIDLDCVEEVSKHSWIGYSGWNAQSKVKGKIVRLHRFVTGANKGDIVTRIKGSKHDLRKENFIVIYTT